MYFFEKKMQRHGNALPFRAKLSSSLKSIVSLRVKGQVYSSFLVAQGQSCKSRIRSLRIAIFEQYPGLNNNETYGPFFYTLQKNQYHESNKNLFQHQEMDFKLQIKMPSNKLESQSVQHFLMCKRKKGKI